MLWQSCNYCTVSVSDRRELSTNATTTTGSATDRRSDSDSRLTLYNTMTECLEPIPSVDTVATTEASDDPTRTKLGLGWYTCGPTTYAPAHLGHARTYVCLDILRRVMTAGGSQKTSARSTITTPGPLFVLNITDVDDKTLAAAAADGGSDPLQLARRYEREFWRDWDDLNCLRPHIVTRVTEHVDSHIVPFIEGLVERGMAYELIEEEKDEENGAAAAGAADGVYFDVRAYNERMGHLTRYGKLAPPAAAQDMDDILLRNKNGNDNGENETNQACENTNDDRTIPSKTKRDPRDFVLWKKRNKGQEAISWSSPWGHGRPGWHIECSAMIEAVQERFRDSHRFLVHAGGIDLKFPHHTNEIAQSEAYLGEGEWIPHWVHTGHLHIDGLKMSKSLKNFVSIEDFLAGRVAVANSNEEEITPAIEDENDAVVQNFKGALESPSDDFRLWCLGLSGSYRGPATFSMSRIEEARSVRHKLLRFLVEGEDWIRSIESVSEESSGPDHSTKKWNDEECDLFQITDRAKRRGLSALENDLDGSAFVSELLVISECGMKYMARNDNNRDGGPVVEPLIHSIREVRELLRLVGFTETTTEAGIRRVGQNTETTSGRVCEEDLVESLVRFRSTVRDVALGDPSAPGMKKLLALADDLRDSILPKIGVQLMDSNKNKESEKDSWKFCLPRRPSRIDSTSPKQNSTSTDDANVDLASIAVLDFFKVGQYEGFFSGFTDDGTPTHNADGSEVSKRLLKKILKKREKHILRLEKNKE